MPKVKPLGVKPLPKKKVLTKFEKAELRAKTMLENDKKAQDADLLKRYEQCLESKLLKGHSQELAEKMAKELIYNQQVV
jgi:regulatory protein YycI of two-component signal transduction system YycFG